MLSKQGKGEGCMLVAQNWGKGQHELLLTFRDCMERGGKLSKIK